jgi:hypothetical protein
MNHPTNLVLLEVADRILTNLGLPKLNTAERNSQKTNIEIQVILN